MRSIMRHPAVAASVFAAAGLIFVACSESPLGPSAVRAPGGGGIADVVASLPNLGTPKLTIMSGDASVHYCEFTTNQAPDEPAHPEFDCGLSANNLTTALTSYNPGWSAPIGASSWIGPVGLDAPSNEYRARPGSYEFVSSFNIPTGATSIALQFQVKSDNAVVVYVNGGKIGQNQFLQDCPLGGTCNWNVVLNMNDVGHGAYKTGPLATDANLLRVDLVATSIGLITDHVSTPASTCAEGPQATGVGGVPTQPDHAAGGNSWVVATCLNPTGVDFVANVFWTVPPPPSTTWCSPGFWKTHPDLWTAYHDVLYSTLTDAAPFGKKAPAGDPTILTVVSNPSVYGGPATNSVADFLSNKAFGTPIGSGVESCPDPSDPRFPLTLPE